jgi:hypothetical protein
MLRNSARSLASTGVAGASGVRTSASVRNPNGAEKASSFDSRSAIFASMSAFRCFSVAIS